MTEAEVVPLARFARSEGLEMRFIEYMPIGADHWERDKVYFAHEILEQLDREVCPLVPVQDYDRRAPAMEFRYIDGGGRVGIIASISPFCMSCNRVRLTAEGKLRNCLFALDEVDLKPLLRSGAAEEIGRLVAQTWRANGKDTKSTPHASSSRCAPMHAIGG